MLQYRPAWMETPKKGDINPLTGDIIQEMDKGHLKSLSTAKEIEVWLIKFTK